MVSAPSAVLVAMFWIGPGRMGLGERRRELAIGLLSPAGPRHGRRDPCVVVTLAHWRPGGSSCSPSAGVVLFTNVVTFALVFWELDDRRPGGAKARAKA